jgi:hypothetical protein
MEMVYSQQALVRIWRNLKHWKLPTSHFGHAAVTVSREGVLHNISFWPGGEGAGLGNALKDLPGSASGRARDDKFNEMSPVTAIRLEVGYCQRNAIAYPPEWDEILQVEKKAPLGSPRPGQKRFARESNVLADLDTKSFSCPIPQYSQSAEAKFYLPGRAARGAHSWGLDLKKMTTWWTRFMRENPTYRAFSVEDNCVGVVLRALREGGAATFVEPPAVRAYGEPVQVEKYALALDQRFKQLEKSALAMAADIAARGLAKTPLPPEQISDGLWRFDVWKKASALGVLHQRSETIREIDSTLDKYHRLTWKYAEEERYKVLLKLFDAVVKHREEKSDSKRSEAVAQLAMSMLKFLQAGKFKD